MPSHNKELSTAGQLFRLLHLSSSDISRSLHVDASLVSKWKSGIRAITPKSLFYEELVEYIINKNIERGQHTLEDFFATLYPDSDSSQPDYLKSAINRMLCSKHVAIPKSYRNDADALCTAEITVYTGGNGRRRAVSQLMRIAAAQKDAGKIVYIDCEQYRWLLEDEAYAKEWVHLMLNLLNRGFELKMILHFSIYQENFMRLFSLCGAVLFHPNAEILYHKYYDEDIYWFSFLVLDNALSIMGLSMHKNQSHTTVFTDAPSIFQHKSIVDFVSKSCFPMFQIFKRESASIFLNMVLGMQEAPASNSIDTYYLYNSIPEFIFAEESLLLDVLRQNNASEAEIEFCILFRQRMSRAVRLILVEEAGGVRLISMLSMSKIREIKSLERVPCVLLSFCCGREITASKSQFELLLADESARTLSNTNSITVLLSDEEAAKMPSENCICKQGEWLAALVGERIKFSKENTMVNTTTVIMEQIWRGAPSPRKQRDFVSNQLKSMRSEI